MWTDLVLEGLLRLLPFSSLKSKGLPQNRWRGRRGSGIQTL